MPLKVDNQNHFVLISSLILTYTAKHFPLSFELSDENLAKSLRRHGIADYFGTLSEVIPATIIWLSDEGYIRKSADKKNTYTITEKGLKSIEYKMQPLKFPYTDFTTAKDDGYSFKENESGREIELKCTGPALKLLPENWLPTD
ncbi:hypothetical protein C7Y70_13145 [Pseudoalteromonas sp. KS88]|uniref:hypothetical protein n=1 Tax=Pseudoalteromonas sp. KS88 TaxID=2109918 RepID=UPI0010809453|nr:hypothetical protein [Pseudoalteromonas sp. KS88]TGE81347.1 hypothetical protein C7Y70_13145 [Pseudoalteromonas sp. KS88]